ncbi:ROK family protein [Sphingomonas suaedae]|uniref:fructokinase n=1 Tax=Sphingomonas suaedae TaxID=2599297 RepID=A0A518RKE6_9SPHN|nr:ROK family protein [Sphingomonas suaedae]QDX27926.1 ROK family protein [Sphingomonas suaedae]
MSDTGRYAGVELGGTKSVAVLAQGDRIVDRHVVVTGEPRVTLSALRSILDEWTGQTPLAGLGIASFGPIRLDRAAPDFGRMLPTPKPGWGGAAILDPLARDLGCPVAIDTDVNAAALAEYRWGAGAGCDSLCYITIGTGLGGGLLIAGRPVHGALHPEIGHLRLRRVPGDSFAGACPFHGDCVEGLVSGPALAKRFGADPANVPDDHPIWRDVASDIAELCATILLTVSAQRILFGGSVALSRPFLLPWVRDHVVERIAGYLPFVDDMSGRDVIKPATLGTEAGPLGAIALAQAARS